MKAKASLLLFLFFLIYSCAPKVCPKPEEVLKKAFKEPKDGVYYGYLKVNFLRIPILIKKQGETEEVKVGYGGVSVSTDTFCYEGTCFELPVKPSEIIYGYFPDDYRVKRCDGEIILESQDGKELFFERGTLKRVRYKDFSLIYGKRTKEGFFRDIVIKINNLKAKLIIEGREV